MTSLASRESSVPHADADADADHCRRKPGPTPSFDSVCNGSTTAVTKPLLPASYPNIVHTPPTPTDGPVCSTSGLAATSSSAAPLSSSAAATAHKPIPIPIPNPIAPGQQTRMMLLTPPPQTQVACDGLLSTSPESMPSPLATAVSFAESGPKTAPASTPASASLRKFAIRRHSSAFVIPDQLARPGMEMLKVSAKSARRAKPRNMWLDVGAAGSEDGEMGLEIGIGLVGGQDVRLCWEKNGFGLEISTLTQACYDRVGSKREASIPIARIRDLRFAAQGSPYRTSLQISADVEPRWMTIIYSVPQTSRNMLNSSTVSYKLVHFIAPTRQALDLWRLTLDKFRDGRMTKGFAVADPVSDVPSRPAVVEESNTIVREAEVHHLCAKLGMGIGSAEIGEAFRSTAAPRDYLDFAAFQRFVKLLKRRGEIESIFAGVAGAGHQSLSLQSWTTFIAEVQQQPHTHESILASYAKYADSETKRIMIDGFASYLMSSDNAILKNESNQDMSRPLPEYFITSSHNTYLVGNQIKGQSTVEGYIRALQQGCRLDIYDGDDGEPVVTHGLTLTSKITLREVLQAIAQYAFLASPYPVILSVEVHCDVIQQDRMVELLVSVLGDQLVRSRLDGAEQEEELEQLPSPNELKGRFLLKAKNKSKFANKTDGTLSKVTQTEDHATSSAESTSSDSDFGRVFRAVRRRVGGGSNRSITPPQQPRPPLSPSSSSSTKSASNASFSQAPPDRLSACMTVEPSEVGAPSGRPDKHQVMSSALLGLLVYTVGVKARGFNKKETYGATHVISIGENSLHKMFRDEGARQDFIAHNRKHLTRAYPKGSRLNSSNFEPHHMWAAGVQLVALNWQTFDTGMELNLAMFSRAGRIGYVLKPELLRKKGGEKDKTALIRSERYTLQVVVISAQQLPKPRDVDDVDKFNIAKVDPFVEVSLYQPGLASPAKKRSKVVRGNAFNPIFNTPLTFEFTAHPSEGMLDLVFLRVEVLNARGNIKAAFEEGKGDPVGAFAISLGALLPGKIQPTLAPDAPSLTSEIDRITRKGYRHVPLYDAVGDQLLFSTLFLKVVLDPRSSGISATLAP
ncbi:BZ3500_MvSof-1268-A1-R1_Chr11-2g03440 [Microbotryum saponariae]|uniref:Phosphoinositide phospholipase C n=1 Tax=Microbotryum saponariae TaxID=289078 RepID=A0A2X0MTH1_9BASI|nr:BZ3500_MvSof-1268-A1-R1_Chr11-2g03440 [Microbotryum saponariae]SDA03380.1 BZ3501_MvSof-1269-A2-R1_Chr11g03011 [Microbotryum saponariae]